MSKQRLCTCITPLTTLLCRLHEITLRNVLGGCQRKTTDFLHLDTVLKNSTPGKWANVI